MNTTKFLRAALIGGASALALASGAMADEFNIPAGDLSTALDAYTRQTGADLIISGDTLRGTHTRGAKGELSADVALARILDGTGYAARRTPSGAIGLVREQKSDTSKPEMIADATPVRAASGVETVVVTSSKIKGDIQTVPIAITALSQEQLTSRQIAGGPDLVKEVPNLTFSKTNFTGYNIQIRGIGTQAISVTTDPAVAVAFNDIPFIRNHFFEQEFYDVNQVEVLRGPQGTLYGRNATAGVVNVISAKPTDHYEAQASVDVGNYNNRRLEGMLNIPVIGDQLDVRVAGEWTKRAGYAFNEQTDQNIDGRDLWSGRVSLLVHPIENLSANLVWEHFSEDDDRMRSTKQLCKRNNAPAVIDGPAGPQVPDYNPFGNAAAAWLSQGCSPVSFYSPEAFQSPNAGAIPFVAFAAATGRLNRFDVYSSLQQSPDLRTISSALNPFYKAKNDTVELNADYSITPALTLTSQTGYSKDFLYSTEDYNRFDTAPGIFIDTAHTSAGGGEGTWVGQDGEFCDPQLGCSSRLVGEDLSQEHAKQVSQELRLASTFSGPLSFSVGANYLHYETVEDYYVFFNVLTDIVEGFSNIDQVNNIFRIPHTGNPAPLPPDAPHIPFDPVAANSCGPIPADPASLAHSFFGTGLGCSWVDPNPLTSLDGQGHNYFRSENPYKLNSWAGFGEVYYQLTPDVKLTGGLRWTDDRKSFTEIPSWALYLGKGFITTGILDQEWKEWTGRFNATWTPKLDFTDQSLFYGSYARGYKGGGANPPSVEPLPGFNSSPSVTTHPLTFEPEFVDAFELGTKNTLLDGAMTLNGDVFYYNYKGYQISQIVDRTSVNLNFDAHVKGMEVESTWEPMPGLRFNFAGGYENATLAKGSQAIDLIDRTAGHAGWMVVRPYVTQTSNCVLPVYVVNEILAHQNIAFACLNAYGVGIDPVVTAPYVQNPDPDNFPGYAGFDPLSADPNAPANVNAGLGLPPNNGEGFAKNLSGNQLPNAPHFTVSLGGQYTMPLSEDWAATLRSDFYWQSQSYARIFNDRPYDKLRGYSTTNLAVVLTNANGWEVMGYVKNVFDTTAITGAFLNSDDTALTTNIFTTDPRLYGVRITKNF
jgi:iron complex outermembrane receptor protein